MNVLAYGIPSPAALAVLGWKFIMKYSWTQIVGYMMGIVLPAFSPIANPASMLSTARCPSVVLTLFARTVVYGSIGALPAIVGALIRLGAAHKVFSGMDSSDAAVAGGGDDCNAKECTYVK